MKSPVDGKIKSLGQCSFPSDKRFVMAWQMNGWGHGKRHGDQAKNSRSVRVGRGAWNVFPCVANFEVQANTIVKAFRPFQGCRIVEC